jgi:uncharacterized protein DUF397
MRTDIGGPDVRWLRSSYSNNAGGDCVEVARGHTPFPVRDSKNRNGGNLFVGAASWAALVTALRAA